MPKLPAAALAPFARCRREAAVTIGRDRIARFAESQHLPEWRRQPQICSGPSFRDAGSGSSDIPPKSCCWR
jgi:hypothetical protein